MVCPQDVLQLLESEEEDVFGRSEDVRLRKVFGLLHQGTLVDEIAADHVVLRIFPISDVGTQAVDHRFGLGGPGRAIRRRPERAAGAPALRPPLRGNLARSGALLHPARSS